MNHFHVGQKVVCVDDKNFRNPRRSHSVIIRGETYTIAELGLFLDGEVGVVVEELGKCGRYQNQPDWLASRFRPVIERKTDISIFTEMLTPHDKVPA